MNSQVRLANVYLKTYERERAYAELQAYLREAPDGPSAESAKKMVNRLEPTNRMDPSAHGSGDILDSLR
jgi:hypothetical protein